MKTDPDAPAPVDGPPRTRILLVDDHPLMRAGLAQLIANEPDLTICGEAGDTRGALDQFARLKPDLVVVDITLPGRDGLELIKDLHALAPEVPLMVVSMQDEELYADRALRAGARGYIMKESGGASVLHAVREVLAGRIYLSPEMVTRFMARQHGGADRAEKSPIARLTDREIEVLRCIGSGKSTSEIAPMLGVSEKTIEVHRFNIRRKLDVGGNEALIRFAVKWTQGDANAG